MSNSCVRIFADPVQIKRCRKKIDESEEILSGLAEILTLSGNDVRLKILYLLKEEGELCPCDMSDILGMTVPAISQHLRKLKDGSIICFRKSGQTIYYSLNPEHMKVLRPFFKYINEQSSKKEPA